MRNLCEKIVCLWGFAFCFLCCAKIAVFANARKKSKVSSPALCWRRHFLWCFVAESPLYVYFSLFSLSGKTIEGLNVFASSGVIMAYDIIMTTSPICAFLAAAPFRQITPLPAGPLIT